MPETEVILPLAALLFFVLFVLVKSQFSLRGADPAMADARRKIAMARQRARAAKGSPKERAAAYREAALIALEELGRPNRAAFYARRADRADPEDPASIRVVARAMVRAKRYPALEKLLWTRLADSAPESERFGATFNEILDLYEGPMRRGAQARVLRRLYETR